MSCRKDTQQELPSQFSLLEPHGSCALNLLDFVVSFSIVLEVILHSKRAWIYLFPEQWNNSAALVGAEQEYIDNSSVSSILFSVFCIAVID